MRRPASRSARLLCATPISRRGRRRVLLPLLLALVAAVIAGAVLQPVSAVAEQAGSSAGFGNVLRLAAADSTALQHRVDAELRARPGGRQVSQYEIAYAGGSVVLALPAPGRRAAPPASAATVRDPSSVNVRAGAVVGDDSATAVGTASVQAFGDSGSCPYSLTTKWYCWYTDASFDGARFQFSSDYCPGLAQAVINFGDWGRDNTATSWVNNRFSGVQVYDGPSGTGALLWTEPRVSSSANVGGSLNDRATSARTC